MSTSSRSWSMLPRSKQRQPGSAGAGSSFPDRDGMSVIHQSADLPPLDSGTADAASRRPGVIRNFLNCIEHLSTADSLEEEGLWRISGAKGEVDRLFGEIIAAEDAAEGAAPVDLSAILDPNVVVGAVKRLVKHYSFPLDRDAAAALAAAYDTSAVDDPTAAVIKVLGDLPSHRRRVLTATTQQMAKVVASERTKMSLHSLSVAFGRTLFPDISEAAVRALVGILCTTVAGVAEASEADGSDAQVVATEVLANPQAVDGSAAATAAGPALPARKYSDRRRKQANSIDKTTEHVDVATDIYAQVVVSRNGITDLAAAAATDVGDDVGDPLSHGTATSTETWSPRQSQMMREMTLAFTDDPGEYGYDTTATPGEQSSRRRPSKIEEPDYARVDGDGDGDDLNQGGYADPEDMVSLQYATPQDLVASKTADRYAEITAGPVDFDSSTGSSDGAAPQSSGGRPDEPRTADTNDDDWYATVLPVAPMAAVPFAFTCCMRALSKEDRITKEGLFRVSGKADNISTMMRAFAAEPDTNHLLDVGLADTHSVAGFMKAIFRDRPDAVLGTNLYQHWMETLPHQSVAMSTTDKIRVLFQVALPESSRAILTRLLPFLRRVSMHSAQNKMHVKNLALVFGPTLLPAPEHVGLHDQLKNTTIVAALVERLIEEQDAIFVPFSDDDAARHKASLPASLFEPVKVRRSSTSHLDLPKGKSPHSANKRRFWRFSSALNTSSSTDDAARAKSGLSASSPVKAPAVPSVASEVVAPTPVKLANKPGVARHRDRQRARDSPRPKSLGAPLSTRGKIKDPPRPESSDYSSTASSQRQQAPRGKKVRRMWSSRPVSHDPTSTPGYYNHEGVGQHPASPQKGLNSQNQPSPRVVFCATPTPARAALYTSPSPPGSAAAAQTQPMVPLDVPSMSPYFASNSPPNANALNPPSQRKPARAPPLAISTRAVDVDGAVDDSRGGLGLSLRGTQLTPQPSPMRRSVGNGQITVSPKHAREPFVQVRPLAIDEADRKYGRQIYAVSGSDTVAIMVQRCGGAADPGAASGNVARAQPRGGPSKSPRSKSPHSKSPRGANHGPHGTACRSPHKPPHFSWHPGWPQAVEIGYHNRKASQIRTRHHAKDMLKGMRARRGAEPKCTEV